MAEVLLADYPDLTDATVRFRAAYDPPERVVVESLKGGVWKVKTIIPRAQWETDRKRDLFAAPAPTPAPSSVPEPTPVPSGGTVIRSVDFSKGQKFDGTNGVVAYVPDPAGSGKLVFRATVRIPPPTSEGINRGWIWADKSNYCLGELAPVGSRRRFSGRFYVTSTNNKHHRVFALSANYSECFSNLDHGSIMQMVVDQGKVRLYSERYGGNKAGDSLYHFTPVDGVAVSPNRWYDFRIDCQVDTDPAKGWAELFLNGQSVAKRSGATSKGPSGYRLNQTQWGSGWVYEGSVGGGYCYIDRPTISSLS